MSGSAKVPRVEHQHQAPWTKWRFADGHSGDRLLSEGRLLNSACATGTRLASWAVRASPPCAGPDRAVHQDRGVTGRRLRGCPAPRTKWWAVSTSTTRRATSACSPERAGRLPCIDKTAPTSRAVSLFDLTPSSGAGPPSREALPLEFASVVDCGQQPAGVPPLRAFGTHSSPKVIRCPLRAFIGSHLARTA